MLYAKAVNFHGLSVATACLYNNSRPAGLGLRNTQRFHSAIAKLSYHLYTSDFASQELLARV